MHRFTSVWARSALFVAVATASASLYAKEENAVQLSNVVVSAAGFEQRPIDAPASITVISQEDLRQNRYNSLAHALSDVEGIDIGQGVGKTGGLNISIRGMPSAYTLVLIDGRRQNSAGGVTPNGFGETSTSFMPPLSSIERIEIIRGPASTLYGSDALGGVINIITKKVGDEWAGTITLDHTYQEDRDWGDTSNGSIFLTGPLVKNILGLQLRASGFNREESTLQFSDGVNVSSRGPSPVDGYNTNLGARLTFVPHADHQIDLDVEQYYQWYNNDEGQLGGLNTPLTGINAGKYKVDGYEDALEFNRHQITLSHKGQFSVGTLSSSLMQNETETIGRLIPGNVSGVVTSVPGAVAGDARELKTTSVVFDTKLVAPIGDNHIAVFGAQVWDVKMYDGIAQTTFKQESWSVFAEDKWNLTESLSLTFGGRYDEYDAFGGHFSPRAYLVWNANDSWTFKGGVSQGFKAPDVNDLHDGVNGATRQGQTVTIGSPDLKPEISTSSEFGIYFDSLSGFSANAAVFYNQFKDKIADGDAIPCAYNTGSCSQKINIGEAVTQGVEAAAAWEFISDWKLGVNYTYTESEQESGADKGQPLTNTPKHLANLKLDWTANDYLNLWVKGEYRGERARFLSTYDNLAASGGQISTSQSIYNTLGKNTKAYTLVHLGATYQLSQNFRVNAAVYNLLDKDFTEGKSYTAYTYSNAGVLTGTGTEYGTDYINGTTGTIQEGRRYWLSLNYDF